MRVCYGKRGMEIGAVHFHSYPFTSEQGEEKVKKSCKNSLNLCRVNLHYDKYKSTSYSKEIAQKCPEKEITILGRIL